MKKMNYAATAQPLSSTTTTPIAVEENLRIAEPILPNQFFTPAHESHLNWTGERLPMLAVLQETVHAYHRYAASKTHRGRRLFSDACSWFWSQERDYLYSFESICLHLQIDPSYVRKGLHHCQQAKAPQQTKVVRASQRRRAQPAASLITLAA